MSEPQRRRLLDGLNATPKPVVPPVVPEAAIAETAARHGFAEVAPRESVDDVPVEVVARRQRKALGRTEQFNVRLKPETLQAIYNEANGRDIPLAQVIEEAIAALVVRTR